MNSTTFLALLLLAATCVHAQDHVQVKGKERLVVERRVGFLDVGDGASVTLQSRADIGHLTASGDAEIVIEGARVAHVRMHERSTLRLRGGLVSHVFVLGNARAHVHEVTIAGGLSTPTFSGNGIVYAPGAQINLYADLIAYNDGVVEGAWANGQRFRLGLIEQPEVNKEIYRRPRSMPAQLVVHELPGPSFDCDRASSRVEHMICDDEVLRRLDKQLAKESSQVLAAAADAEALRLEQRRWLRERRNRCEHNACLVAAYRERIHAIADSGEMTNQRAQAICSEVVSALNDGSIVGRLVKFADSDPTAGRRWREDRPDEFLNLAGTFSFSHKGKRRTLGSFYGGGTCATCSIADVDARTQVLYPSDDEQERLRWADWGHCDHFLWVKGEPIVVTGSFHGGHARATLVAWMAPDGAKRALCYLGREAGVRGITARAANAQLCSAVLAGRVEGVRWDDSFSISEIGSSARWEKAQAAALDVDMDGNEDTVGRFEYSSGAGCGSTQQWLNVLTRREPAVAEKPEADPLEQYGVKEEKEPEEFSVSTGDLDQALRKHGQGPILASDREDARFTLSFFKFEGRPYLMTGHSEGAAVLSFWTRRVRTLCEFRLLPQHRVEVLYPIETWPRP